jgi:arginine-tRNA-protein transferase
MQYKVRYRPMERLGRDGWHGFEPGAQEQAIDRLGRADGADAMPTKPELAPRPVVAGMAEGFPPL